MACMAAMGNATKVSRGISRGKKHMQDLGVDGRITLIWIIKKEDGRM
jgi:hypothetical protein